jgi:thiol:disulfide interchange protein DsbD
MKFFVRSTLVSLCAVAAAAFALAGDRPVVWQVALVPAAPAVGTEAEVVISARIAPAWIVYASDFKADVGPQPTQFSFVPSESFRLVGELTSVNPKHKRDKTWDTEFTYFETRAEFRQKITVVKSGLAIAGRIKGQLCNEHDGTCTLFEESFKL